MTKMNTILGIETSCDDTGVAIYDGERGLLGHLLSSQSHLHARFGGIVPELASRDHLSKTLPLIDELLMQSGITKSELDAIAYTAGPGLQGALLVGASLAMGMAQGLGIPSLGIHHMEAHFLVALMQEPTMQPPFLSLLVSGGHSLLILVEDLGRYRILGQTLDDAIGETFDKVARMLGLGYPGGPAIEQAALQGDSCRFAFPRPIARRQGYDFSFSGLKTSVYQCVQKQNLTPELVADISASFQQAALDCLLIKSARVIQDLSLPLVVAGGVSANRLLKRELMNIGRIHQQQIIFPAPEFCNDNGAMVAYTGYLRLQNQQWDSSGIKVHARWPIDSLTPIANKNQTSEQQK